MIHSNFNRNFSETGTQDCDDEDEGTCDENSIEEMCRSLFGNDLSRLGIDLYFCDVGTLLHLAFVDFFGLSRPPYKFHKFRFDGLRSLNEVKGLIIPYHKQRIRGDESSELMFPCTGKILDGWENLDSKTVHQRHINGVWRPLQERLDDPRVDSHGDLRLSATSFWNAVAMTYLTIQSCTSDGKGRVC